MSKFDDLVTCKRCGSDACYKQEVSEEITNYQCMGCGFQTNTLMTEDNKFYQEQIEVLPELYKDILHKDEDGIIWMPSTTNIPDKGLVFVTGTSAEDWQWAGVKIAIVDDKPKMDMKTMQKFSERDYMEALDYIGVFEKKDEN
tara:strand:- start:6539 stop:6967 length:429 start_codon:yes stop_codon:yes gene_type:complete